MQAGIPYTVATGEKLVNETFGPNNIHRKTSGTQEWHAMEVRDGRQGRFSLDENGFVFVEHKTAVRDFLSEELEQVVLPRGRGADPEPVGGEARPCLRPHAALRRRGRARGQAAARAGALGAQRLHRLVGPNRVRELLPDEAETLLDGRFAIIQVWRAINQPIQSNPLAIADAKSVAPDDLLIAERRYPHRVGQTYRLKYSPRHRWFYFPQMRRDEALVFKVYDSEKDGRARFTPHTSFDDPTTPPGAPPRQSIEARALVFF